MQSIGEQTLSLMTEAVYNYIQNLSKVHATNEEINNQFNVCLDKLEALVVIANAIKTELKQAA